jgi:hypothetical protein
MALPFASVARTAVFVAPDAVRRDGFLRADDVVARGAARFGDAAVDDLALPLDRAGVRAGVFVARAERLVREREGDERPFAVGGAVPSCEFRATSAWRSLSASATSWSSRV